MPTLASEQNSSRECADPQHQLAGRSHPCATSALDEIGVDDFIPNATGEERGGSLWSRYGEYHRHPWEAAVADELVLTYPGPHHVSTHYYPTGAEVLREASDAPSYSNSTTLVSSLYLIIAVENIPSEPSGPDLAHFDDSDAIYPESPVRVCLYVVTPDTVPGWPDTVTADFFLPYYRR